MRSKNHAPTTLAVIAVTAAGCLISGCDARHSDHAVIGVDRPVALADQPIHLTISGLAPDDTVQVSATVQGWVATRGHRPTTWTGRAVFRTDDRGTVDLDHTRPRSGTYTGVDGMGLFWSMVPATGDPDESYFSGPPVSLQRSYDVDITVTAHGHRLATRTLNREWLTDGVTAKALTIAADGVDGDLFLPPQ